MLGVYIKIDIYKTNLHLLHSNLSFIACPTESEQLKFNQGDKNSVLEITSCSQNYNSQHFLKKRAQLLNIFILESREQLYPTCSLRSGNRTM